MKLSLSLVTLLLAVVGDINSESLLPLHLKISSLLLGMAESLHLILGIN